MYVVESLILTAMALASCRHGTGNLERLLSLAGITAAAFEEGSLHTDISTKDVYDRYHEEVATSGKFTSRI